MTETALMILPDLMTEKASLSPLEERATSIEIVDQDTYDAMAEVGLSAATAKKAVKARFKEGKEASRKAWKCWTEMEAELLNLVGSAAEIARGKIGAWEEEQEVNEGPERPSPF